MKSIILLAVIVLSATVSLSQINNPITEKVKVYGNCGMCKNTIEEAASKKKTSKAEWNEETKMATITYDSKKINLDAVLKNIALAGYDNESFLAPDEAYDKLPGCCRYDRVRKKEAIITQPAKDTTRSGNKPANHQHSGMNNAAQETNQLAVVFDSYFTLKDALVKTDGNVASAKAKDLQTAMNAVKMDKLAMNVHTVWMKVINDLKEDAGQIYSTKNISPQRNHFMSLSKTMYELMKVAQPAETVYYQFCPMANNGKGANWLSRESGVKNPYYGAEMLTCGKTVETIKP